MNDESKPDAAPQAELQRLAVVVDRARRGDTTALPELRAALAAHPQLWRECSQLAAVAERAWLELICGPDLLLHEALRRRLAALRCELSGPEPSPLERLLVEQLVGCWLQSQFSAAAAAQLKDAPLAQARFAEERQCRAQRRFLQATVTLATVRRLLPAGPLAAVPVPKGRDDPPSAAAGDRGGARWPVRDRAVAARAEGSDAAPGCAAALGQVLPLGTAGGGPSPRHEAGKTRARQARAPLRLQAGPGCGEGAARGS